ncbi:MAG TPA: pyridoxal phosphate-dependent aminotransferase [Blastocatellia bacterium]|nr:pyridoxal phosphate-dependent aminotransferase [Blastocatellia bacterium]
MSNMAFPVSHRAQKTKASSIAAIVAETERLRAQGVEVMDLGAGEPDFPTPEHIKAAAKRALDENFTRYTVTSGVMALKEAICRRSNEDFGSDYEPSQCCVTVGGKMGIFNAVMALINPGDGVLVERPCWVTFPEIINFAEGKMIPIETEATDFHLTAGAVRRAITPEARLIIINSPSNPTGRVIDPAEFKRIVEVAVEHGLWVISDECYLQFAYPPGEPFSAAALPARLRERVLVVGSLSKTYAMTGWRVGFTLGPREWVNEVIKIQTQITSNANSIAQKAAIAALTESQQAVKEMLAEYQRRADWLVPALNEIPGVRCGRPEGAFYAFPDVKQLMKDCGFETSKQLADTLLADYGVALTSGSAFGIDGYLRLSYANSLGNIQRAVERIRKMQRERAR